jgi:hypothetical protein
VKEKKSADDTLHGIGSVHLLKDIIDLGKRVAYMQQYVNAWNGKED